MAKLKLLSTIFSKLGSLTNNNGQIIVARDSKSLYVDLDDERIEITDWIDINTEENLLAILTPLTNKYYYTKDSNKIWRYIGGEWICVNANVNELTPTYAESTSLVKLSSGEKLSVAFGKISKAITDLISHIGDSVKHITSTERTNWGKAYTHSQSTHARTDATKVEKSSTNGNIKINGTETTVYTHPGSGTNPHGTTKSDVGLGNVGNFKAVSTVASQGLTDDEKSNARTNIGAQVAGSYASSTHNHDDKYQAKGSYASASHTHDDRYYTESEMNTKLGRKVDLSADGVSNAINKLSVGSSVPSDADYYISQYANGGTTTTSYHRRPVSALWSYIKSKSDSVYSALGHTHTKSQITDFPTSMPANGGNSSTVNNHTVNSDVPTNAKFTDTTYAVATTSANGIMLKDMVSKLNNCRREVWSSTTPSIDLNDHWIYEY